VREVKHCLIASPKGEIQASIHYPENGSLLYKLAIICPGFFNSKNCRDMVRLAEMFAENGYTAVRFNPAGTWESSGDVSDYSVAGCVEDMRDIHREMWKESAYSHTIVCGHCVGGTAALLYAAKYDDVSASVAIMPLVPLSLGFIDTCYGLKEKEMVPCEKVRLSLCEKIKTFSVPYSFFEKFKNSGFLSEVAKITCPVFLFAGEFDLLASPGKVYDLYRVITSGNKTYLSISGVTHDYHATQAETDKVNSMLFQTLKSFYTRL
jgi:pimeloyl-ACP methyl ester carboxylesterase